MNLPQHNDLSLLISYQTIKGPVSGPGIWLIFSHPGEYKAQRFHLTWYILAESSTKNSSHLSLEKETITKFTLGEGGVQVVDLPGPSPALLAIPHCGWWLKYLAPKCSHKRELTTGVLKKRTYRLTVPNLEVSRNCFYFIVPEELKSCNSMAPGCLFKSTGGRYNCSYFQSSFEEVIIRQQSEVWAWWEAQELLGFTACAS